MKQIKYGGKKVMRLLKRFLRPPKPKKRRSSVVVDQRNETRNDSVAVWTRVDMSEQQRGDA